MGIFGDHPLVSAAIVDGPLDGECAVAYGPAYTAEYLALVAHLRAVGFQAEARSQVGFAAVVRTASGQCVVCTILQDQPGRIPRVVLCLPQRCASQAKD